LLVGPEQERKISQLVEGVKFHAKESPKTSEPGSEFIFEERPVSLMPAEMILVRVMLAKVEDAGKLAQLLRQVPIRQGEVEGWNCVFWVKEALLRIEQSKGVVGTRVVEWRAVRDAALSCCQQKKDEHRFDGKGKYDHTQVPTRDLISMKEIAA